MIEALLAVQREVQERHDRRQKPVVRGQHPKQHGCVLAEWTVDPELPESLRHGIFRPARTFRALVRFSNARVQDDRLPDVHGMAVKLLGVEGARLLDDGPEAKTQDFVLIDHPVFFARDVADLVPLMIDFRRLMLGSSARRALTLLKGAVSPDRRFRILRAMLRKRPTSPLCIQYWTTTPFQLGTAAVKLTARPEADEADSAGASGRDRLRSALASHLHEREARFQILVQTQRDPVRMPIEDATVRWNEREAPYQKVATLRIPPQQVVPDAPDQLGEHLSFTPWHGLLEHRPLGGINRARRRIYEELSRRRRELNGLTAREPSEDEVQAIWRTSAANGATQG